MYLFKVLKEKRKVLKCYLHQLYAFIIPLDEYSDKEKVRNRIYKCQSFLKEVIQINQMEIQHETMTYYCFIKYQGKLLM